MRSNFTALIISQTKFETIISKDVGGDRFQAKTHGWRQIQDVGRRNFLPVAPMVMTLIFWKTIAESFPKMYTLPPSDLKFLNNDII